MNLKGRLKLVADKTPCCDTVCDVGTDHAYVPIYLISRGICKRAIAADVKKGPILAAERNILSFKLEEYIEARLGSGLMPINEGEADVIIIAGMGGILIKEILMDGFNKAVKAQALILQPMNAIEITREWLYTNGFDIYDEELIDEGEKIYTVISARWSGNVRKVEEIHKYIGEKLIQKKDPLLGRYINKRLRELEKIIIELKNSENSGTLHKHFEMKEQLETVLRDWECNTHV